MHFSSNRELFLRHQAQTSRFPLALEIERAEGIYLYGTDGKKYMDLISGISVSSLGHGNSRVKQAIIDQVEKHMHVMVYGEMIQAPQVKLAGKLASLLPPPLQSIYFVNSGAEATDGALKLAKRFTGRTGIIAFNRSYHGSSHAALSLNSEEYFRNAFRPLLPDIRFIEFNEEPGLANLTELTACVIVEPIKGEAGYITAAPGFMQKLRDRCNEFGVLLIFDEIQSGMGRSGKMFAFEHECVTPDILLLGKALGAGMPIGAFISSDLVMGVLTDHPILGHLTTFGGHPVIAAAALAGIEELERLGLINQISEKEHLFRSLLTHRSIKNISGKGLMLALELESFEFNKRLIDTCIEDGLITDWFLFAMNRLRIAPPLTITKEEITAACMIINRNLDKISLS